MTRKRQYPETPKKKATRRGRNSELIERRDRKLLLRFYQLSEVQRIRLDDVLGQLSTEEFFISEQRIWDIIKQNLALLDQIKAGELSIAKEDVNQLKLL